MKGCDPTLTLFFLGFVFAAIAYPPLEQCMSYIYSLFEIVSLKHAVIKAQLQEQLLETQNPSEVHQVLGFTGEEIE